MGRTRKHDESVDPLTRPPDPHISSGTQLHSFISSKNLVTKNKGSTTVKRQSDRLSGQRPPLEQRDMLVADTSGLTQATDVLSLDADVQEEERGESANATNNTSSSSSHTSLDDLPKILPEIVPRTSEHLQFYSDLRDYMDKGKFDPQICCSYFLKSSRQMKLLKYHRHITDGLGELASVVQDCLNLVDERILRFTSLHVSSSSAQNQIGYTLKEDGISSLFIEFIMNKTDRKPTEQVVKEIILEWKAELKETVDFYRSVELSGNGMRARYAEVLDRLKICRNDDYLNLVYELFLFVYSRNQDVNPFVFVCAPSGSGKSSLAYNLANHKCPMIYSVFQSSWDDQTQDAYRPFEYFSKTVMSAIKSDLDMLLGKNTRDPELVSRSNLTDAVNQVRPFKTVHLYVELFAQMLKAQKNNSRFQKSWMEVQLSIDRLKKGKMSLVTAKDEIARLMKSRGKDLKLEPLIAFIDECVLDHDTEGGDVSKTDSAEMVFLRNILRIIKVIPVLAGTDARSSNFCGKNGIKSRIDLKNPIWAIVLSDLHSFNTETLKQLCEKVPLSSHPNVKPILDFLFDVHTYETPWLIQLTLDYICSLDEESVSTSSVRILLNKLLIHLYNVFIVAKNMYPVFVKAQMQYALSREWQDYNLLVHDENDICINRHLGRLKIDPSAVGAPFCALHLIAGGKDLSKVSPYYLLPKNLPLTDSSKRAVDISGPPFHSKSYFPAFSDTPLTGLTLFGLELSTESHPEVVDPPFFSEKKRVSTIDAAFPRLWKHKCLVTGKFLEIVYTLATIVASRASGSSGCSFTKFLKFFVREISSGRSSGPKSPIARKFDEIMPTIDFGDYKRLFQNKMIPLLSPMSVVKWSAPTVRLMKKAAADGECRLGTFLYSCGNEKVDHVVVEFKEETDISTEQTDPTLKIYNKYIDREQLNLQNVKGIPLVAECKQWCRSMSLSNIKKVILDKFKILPSVHPFDLILHDADHQRILEEKDCRTFIIFTVSVSDLENPNQGTLHEINRENFYLWFMKNKIQYPRPQGAEQISDDYLVSPVEGQLERAENAKDVIVIALNQIIPFELYEKTPSSKAKRKNSLRKTEYERKRHGIKKLSKRPEKLKESDNKGKERLQEPLVKKPRLERKHLDSGMKLVEKSFEMCRLVRALTTDLVRDGKLIIGLPTVYEQRGAQFTLRFPTHNPQVVFESLIANGINAEIEREAIRVTFITFYDKEEDVQRLSQILHNVLQ